MQKTVKHILGRLPSGLILVGFLPEKPEKYMPEYWVTEGDKSQWTAETITFHCSAPGEYTFMCF